ncbi:MAG TPA: hypothetical protein VJ652_15025 [Noviherbaspirillum sp.]|nr:hypothetical protein [Noviherbaspirillum sp.]
MFDLSDDSLTRLKKDSPIDRLQVDTTQAAPSAENPLDDDKHTELHRQLMSYYRLELNRQADNRYQQAIDADYYDSLQWTPEEEAELKKRGQAPTVYNVTATSCDYLMGSEKRGRTDFKILPRGKEDAKPAEAKTKYMKYLSDVNRTPWHRSRAFEDAVKVGIGWIEEGVQDEDDGEPIYCRYESWRNMLWDSAATEIDGSDSRYQFRSKWVDEDIAKALFPQRAGLIEASVSDGTIYAIGTLYDGDIAMDSQEWELANNGIAASLVTHKRRRVRLIEAWYRTPETVDRLRGGPFNGEIYDGNDPRHAQSVQDGTGMVVSKVMMRVRVACMTTKGLLWEGPSPYRHNRFKFIPVWGYRRDKDGLPYGVIRRMRDIQDSVNKTRSKAQYILSTNKIIMDEGALPEGMTIDDFAEEAAKPDAILVKRKGYDLQLSVERDLAAPFLNLMSQDIQMIQQTSGVTDEQLGRATNAMSGIAVERRQEQGSLASTKLFDNLRLSEQIRGEIELSLVEQFATEEKQFRITNMRGSPEFVTMNDGLPENDISRTKADFVISEADWRATMRQAASDQLMDMLTKMPPQVAMVMLDLLVENMDVPNRDEIVKRIRSVNGQRDPDATELTPEEQQQMQASAEAQQMQARAAMAEVSLKEAQAAKAQAEAGRTTALKVKDAMDAAAQSMVAATAVVSMPTIAKVADNLLLEAGWESKPANGAPPVQGLPAMPAQQPPTVPNDTMQAEQQPQ